MTPVWSMVTSRWIRRGWSMPSSLVSWWASSSWTVTWVWPRPRPWPSFWITISFSILVTFSLWTRLRGFGSNVWTWTWSFSLFSLSFLVVTYFAWWLTWRRRFCSFLMPTTFFLPASIWRWGSWVRRWWTRTTAWACIAFKAPFSILCFLNSLMLFN